MTSSPLFAIALAIFATFLRLVSGDSSSACNPLNGPCPAIPGLATGEYFMDFTQQTTTPSDWILADYATVGYGPNGANFTFAKRYDAPYIWTRFYLLFGRIEVVVRAAPGAGIITSSVMMSDDLDEIDWEWSGNNFAGSSGAVQTNYFGKGQVGNSDRGSQPVVDDPEHKFHTYSLDWQPDKLVWSIDDVAVRTLENNGATTGSYQYPQTPSRLHLGLWCSGDPSTPYGTVYWGGGYTNFSAAPFSAYVKSVKITTNNVCSSWQYPSPFDGTYQSVQCTNQTIALPCTYTVVAGDDGSKIAKNLTVNFDTLKGANPGVNWDQLLIGQVLNVPGGTCQISTMTSTSVTSSVSFSSSMTSSATFSSTASFTSNLTSWTSASSLYTSPSSSSLTSSSTTTSAFSSLASSSPTALSTAQPSYSSMPSSASTTASGTTSAQPNSNSTPAVMATSTSALITVTSTTGTSSFTTLCTTAGVDSTATAAATTSSAPSQSTNSYTVVAGDYGWAIANALGCSWDDLNAANPGVNWDNLQIGQTLNVPTQTTSYSTSTASSSSGPAVTSDSTSGGQWTSSTSAAASDSASVAPSGPVTTSTPVTPSGSTGISASVAPSGSTNTSGCGSGQPCGGQVGNQSSSSQPALASSAVPTSTSVSTSPTVSSSASAAYASGTTPSGAAGTSPTSPVSSTSASAGPETSPVSQLTSSQPVTRSNAVNPVTPTPSSLSKMICNQDNCLRNLIDPRYSSTMRNFCSSYTTKASNTAPLPTFLAGCSADARRVSSACSCLITSFGTGTATSGTPAMTGPPLRAGSPSWKQTPSWKLKRSPLRWNRPAL
ncbi:uncharacterized protein Z519_08984 [Cladophialophora bantiana CBS 173.52]|uniref:GH16 domain-containing protein n=1 Tax=Cladophialophora bantiana (strain ATCC 10958 / CBS 173.52 / CDC B-1940 / NIH 8579) TaxID=1442370 RepID=A0A0D2HHR7_CLAB1|nr:uncharacterized protein Z519_08984 [Cladophialophora bantiana CBS 173.52]KIW90340.1 hypothetical protein Z519_08984 [Cladophialophora bantiana CBS 173.52]